MHNRLTGMLFYIAGFVLILHNITPHVHYDEPDAAESSIPDTLLDWLSFAFHIDPGAGHLECFSKPDQVDIDSPDYIPVSATATQVSSALIDRQSSSRSSEVVRSPITLWCWMSSGLRGPPSGEVLT